VVDGERNAVSMTYTLEQGYGVKIVVPGAGFLLNNEMGAFNAGPELTNAEGLIGTKPNLAEPGKRRLSSMTPTILAKDGQHDCRIASISRGSASPRIRRRSSSGAAIRCAPAAVRALRR
jgi:gamma-glutamyltranspeptidase/glutathione hydrolase